MKKFVFNDNAREGRSAKKITIIITLFEQYSRTEQW